MKIFINNIIRVFLLAVIGMFMSGCAEFLEVLQGTADSLNGTEYNDFSRSQSFDFGGCIGVVTTGSSANRVFAFIENHGPLAQFRLGWTNGADDSVVTLERGETSGYFYHLRPIFLNGDIECEIL